MLTNLGRILRKIRIDHNEILASMAGRLNVTASYLSAVENGKRAAPYTWESVILKSYQLDERQKDELHKAFVESASSVSLDLSDADYNTKETIFAFARKAVDLPDDKLREIRKILGGD